jgi:hypothetical protein
MTCDLQHPATRVAVRTLATGDHEWVVETLTKSWGSTSVVSRGKVHEAHHLPGLVAETAGIRAGLATYSVEDAQMEVVTLEAVPARLVAVHRDAVRVARALKPLIPRVGNYGIPVLDELELELPL